MTDQHRVLLSDRLFDVLLAAGIFRADEKIRRVIIDINQRNAVIMHVERFGDTRLLDIVRSLDGAVIRRDEPVAEDKPKTDKPAEERRGGDRVDWAHAEPGAELPLLPEPPEPKTRPVIDPDYNPEPCG